jgi:hypothetical protein
VENCSSWATVNFGKGSVEVRCTREIGHEGHHNADVVWEDDTEPELRR